MPTDFATHAVITGDIIGSSQLSSEQRQQLPQFLEQAAQTITSLQPGCIEGELEAFRGDSWQAYLPNPSQALAVGLMLRCHLWGERGIETRLSIGFGTVDHLDLDKISLSQGEAFVLSGRGLNDMEDGRIFALHSAHPLQPLLDAIAALFDAQLKAWTQKQAQAAALALSGKPQSELAQSLQPPISAQAFGKHLASANWKLVKTALDSFAKASKKLFAQK